MKSKNLRELIVLFGALEEGYAEIDGLNFIYVCATAYSNNEEIGSCSLNLDGTIEDGTQEGIFQGQYSVDTSDYDEITYHNNEDGTDYTIEEFIKEFVGNDKYKMIGDYATKDNIYLEGVGTL